MWRTLHSLSSGCCYLVQDKKRRSGGGVLALLTKLHLSPVSRLAEQGCEFQLFASCEVWAMSLPLAVQMWLLHCCCACPRAVEMGRGCFQ